MRRLSETTERWQETMRQGGSLCDLRRAVKFNGPSSPCVSGFRSVCWKVFLLSKETGSPDDWARSLAETRALYEKARQEHLLFIKHPEQLNALSVDPLADDPDSPWDMLRRDEEVRAEMAQDVRRLPDEPFYHKHGVQTMILDVLFLYCKLHPGVGGYRQGMHELLAPIMYVVHHDAIDGASVRPDGLVDMGMLDMLDMKFVEHDAFAMFCKVMEPASRFYEVTRVDGTVDGEQSAIVEKSEHIHEHVLMRVDPELASHLKNVDVLPQIFLIRWIRLLFGREFPFEQLLLLWDTMFAYDPRLELTDLICTAMLVRIRSTLLDADHSAALQVLLKYPAPQPPHGPHTFVDDALYLKDHLNVAGGAALVMKYTGKTPSATTTTTGNSSRPVTPTTLQGFARQRTLGARSPLSASARLLQHPGGVEALFAGAAKGVMERGEKLGINQAVRDAVGEMRRNMQSSPFRGHENTPRPPRAVSPDPSAAALVAVQRRNRQLAALLEESITGLKALAASVPRSEGQEEEKSQVDAIELAAARIQLVKVYLEDPTLVLPNDDNDDVDMPAVGTLSISSSGRHAATVAIDMTPVVVTSSAVDVAATSLSRPGSDAGVDERKLPGVVEETIGQNFEDRMDTVDGPETQTQTASPPVGPALATGSRQPLTVQHPTPTAPPPLQAPTTEAAAPARPSAAMPTRSTLAQSSFAWMLDDPDMALATTTPSPGPSSSSAHARKTAAAAAGGRGRDRNAFLFGEVTTSPDGDGEVHVDARKLSADHIFGLRPMRKSVRGCKAP